MNPPNKIRYYAMVGEALRAKRLERKMSMKDAADASRVLSVSSIAAAEEGRACSFFCAAVLAEVYDCMIDELAPLDATDAP